MIDIKDGGCILEAIRLRQKNGNKGDVYYVDLVEGILVGHAYYVPDKTRLSKLALNQTDNGYYDKPPMCVSAVLKYGRKYTKDGM